MDVRLGHFRVCVVGVGEIVMAVGSIRLAVQTTHLSGFLMAISTHICVVVVFGAAGLFAFGDFSLGFLLLLLSLSFLAFGLLFCSPSAAS